MTINASTPYGIYCDTHGLQFISEVQYYNNELRCRIAGCVVICDKEHVLLHLAMNEGCHFCGKTPIKAPFIYLAKEGEIYCHLPCLRCKRKICAHRDCINKAHYVIYLQVQDDEYLIPASFCKEHKRGIRKRPDDAMWAFIHSMMKHEYQRAINRDDCKLIVKRID